MSSERLPPPTFGEWLDDQLKQRKWSRPRLARKIDYSPATVTAWVVGVRTPEPRACKLIADAFGIDAIEVLERAGRLEDAAEARAEQGQSATASATLAHNDDDDVLVYTMYDLLQRTSLTDAAKEHVRQTIEYVRKRDRDVESGMG